MILSADDFFMKDGEYNFDPSRLEEAHHECLKKFVQSCVMLGLEKKLKIAVLRGISGSGKSTWARLHKEDFDIIVDNTNTTLFEIIPYVNVGKAFGNIVMIYEFNCDPIIAAARNIHKVPQLNILRQFDHLRNSDVLQYVKNNYVCFNTDK